MLKRTTKKAHGKQKNTNQKYNQPMQKINDILNTTNNLEDKRRKIYELLNKMDARTKYNAKGKRKKA